MSRKPSRRAPSRDIKPRILIVTEGETEENYFKMLKKEFKRIPIDIVPKKGKHSNPHSVVQTAHEEIKKARCNPYTTAFAVVDKEVSDSNLQCLSNAIVKANKFPLKNLIKCDLIISNPSFEFWLLMHFYYTTHSFNNVDEIIDKLRIFISDYKKAYDFENKTGFFQNLEKAIENSKKCEYQYGESFDPLKSNPSTQVYKVIEEIKDKGASL